MAGFVVTLKTDKDVSFTGALATNAIAYADLAMPSALEGPGGRARVRLTMINIISTEHLDWELFLWSKDTHATSDPDTNSFLGFWSFQGMGEQIAAAGLWYYFISGLDVPYNDADGSGELHVGLVNRSIASKSAGGAGALAISFTFEEELA